MKRIIESKKIFGITQEKNLAELKTIYRNLMKEWHPDKFKENDDQIEIAEAKSKTIIEAYHFLVSISSETHAADMAEYTLTTTTAGIDDYQYKGLILKITFQNDSSYEYFGVPKSVYNKLNNSSAVARFARRHIFHEFTYRNITGAKVEDNKN